MTTAVELLQRVPFLAALTAGDRDALAAAVSAAKKGTRWRSSTASVMSAAFATKCDGRHSGAVSDACIIASMIGLGPMRCQAAWVFSRCQAGQRGVPPPWAPDSLGVLDGLSREDPPPLSPSSPLHLTAPRQSDILAVQAT